MDGTAVTRFYGDERNIGRSRANLSGRACHPSRRFRRRPVCRSRPRDLSLLLRR
ncbi:hypothetical protein BRPE64_BCDS03740 [Caballeronia insecticola]|uniref:Uncharacterized protein n=1 Tax=Caballeronia insecticola TaxID=758793 RepID=R4WVI1_9BURK|nr:hypothetical protein BRPE64_BCDS03740 [Caballeronia insecticola]